MDRLMDTLSFENRQAFRDWLNEHHHESNGFWMQFDKSAESRSLRPDEALEEALCFGWIDGQIKSIDHVFYLKKFTPRRKHSKWSNKNKGIAARLIDLGLMTPAGLEAMDTAKREGTWDEPIEDLVPSELAQELLNKLQGHELALANFLKMPPSVRRTYTAFYLDAKKEETKIKRLEQIVQRLNENKKPM